MAQMLEALGEMFEEDFVPGFEDFLRGIDQPYQNVISSSERVVQDEITKAYKAIHTFVTSLAGAVRPTSPLGPQMVANTGATQVISGHDTYPGVNDVPLPGIDQRYVQLGKLHGSVVMSLAMERAGHLHTVDDYPATVLQQFAHLLAHTLAMSWYLDDSGRIIDIDADHANVSVARVGHTCTITQAHATTNPLFVPGTGALARLKPAMQFDVWYCDRTGPTMASCFTQRGWAMLVSQLNLFGKENAIDETMQLYFQNEQDAIDFAALTGAFASDITLVPYNSIPDKTADGVGNSIMPMGYLWWLRNTGTIFGSFGDGTVTATSHGSFFRSSVSAVGGSITESHINDYVRRFEQATGLRLDTILTTPGVVVNILATSAAWDTATVYVRSDRTGRAEDLEWGWDRIGYRYGGRVFDLQQSEFLPTGTGIAAGNEGEMVLLKARGGNLIRYEPPGRVEGTEATPSSGKAPAFDPRIEWLGKRFGDSIWMPSLSSSGGRTDGAEAPYDLIMQHAAQDVRGIRFTGILEGE